MYFEITQTHNRKPNNIQKTSPQSYKIQIKILADGEHTKQNIMEVAKELLKEYLTGEENDWKVYKT